MIYAKGQKGRRSKAEVRLSMQRIFGYVVFSVFEGDKLTHQFTPDEQFIRAMVTEAGLDLRLLADAKSSDDK